MFANWGLCLTAVSLLVVDVNGETRVAIAHLVKDNISGSILFTETTQGLHVTGNITGLDAGHYGFHVHALGDVNTCDDTGPHFDPEGNNHGGPTHDVRHVGDLGNVEFVGNDSVIAIVNIMDSMITLRGRNSILGRALVLHEQMDDLGLGGHATSLTTGNAGARVACGVIGIKSPADPWNSGISITPSTKMMVTIFFVIYLFKN